jgi:hypothetical protein
MENKKNIILVYCVTYIHFLNFKKIEKKVNSDICYLFENKIDFSLKGESVIKKESLDTFILENYSKISMCIFSTAQLRHFPMMLLFKVLSNNIKAVSIEETSQMFLHNSNLNNYILPMNYYLVNSNYEKNEFIKIGYPKDKLIVTGWPYFSKIKKNLNIKKNILLILNASNMINPISHETIEIQDRIILNINKNINNENIYVKFHPSENINHVTSLKKKYNKINYLPLNTFGNEIINEFDFIIISGYSQLFLEALLYEKNILILDIKNNKKLINEFNLNTISIDDLSKNLKDEYLLAKNNFDILKSIHLSIDSNLAINNVANFLNNKKILSYDSLINSEFLLWLNILNFNTYVDTKKLFINKKNLIKLSFADLNRVKFLQLLSLNKNKKIYLPLVIYFIKYLNKNNLIPNTKEFEHILNVNKSYVLSYFFWDFQFLLLNLYKIKNINFYNLLNLKIDEISHSYIQLLNKKFFFILKIKNNKFLKKSFFLRKIYYFIFKFLFLINKLISR